MRKPKLLYYGSQRLPSFLQGVKFPYASVCDDEDIINEELQCLTLIAVRGDDSAITQHVPSGMRHSEKFLTYHMNTKGTKGEWSKPTGDLISVMLCWNEANLEAEKQTLYHKKLNRVYSYEDMNRIFSKITHIYPDILTLDAICGLITYELYHNGFYRWDEYLLAVSSHISHDRPLHWGSRGINFLRFKTLDSLIEYKMSHDVCL